MSSDGADWRHTPIAWLKRLRHSGEYSDVIVRVAHEEFKLHLLLLLSDSTYFHQQVDVNPGPKLEPKLVVDLIDFPGGPEIFHVVVDHWYGSMKHEISTLNVAKVMSASDFLGIEGLKSRALKFLEENVFNCWKSSLTVLATLDCKEDPPLEDGLFDECADAILDRIITKNPLNLPEISDCPMFCNVTHLLTVVALLPANLVKIIYDWILAEVPGLFYEVEDSTETPAIVLFVPREDAGFETLLKSEFDEVWIRWVEKLPELLPDLAKRAMLLAGLCQLMTQGEDNVPLSMSFLCSLLVEMVEVSEAMASKDVPINDWDTIMEDTEFYVSLNMDLVRPNVLLRCKFATVVAMVKHVKSWSEKDLDLARQIRIDQDAKALDAYIVAHLYRGTLSVAEVLSIYQHFPNSARSSHVDLYNVFESLLQSKTLSFEQRQDLGQMLDFKKLPDRWVQRIFREVELDHEPRLLKRVLKIHEKNAKRIKIKACSSFVKESLVLVKHLNVFMTAEAESGETKDKDHSVKLSLKLHQQQQAVELAAERDERWKLEGELQVKNAELSTMSKEKLRLESMMGDQNAKDAELIAVNKENSKLKHELDAVRQELEEERDERSCQICFDRPRDAQCLPCKHFLYCYTCLNQHIQQSSTCPMCRTPSTGVNRIGMGAN